MVFNETPLEGAYTIDISPIPDARGFFARAWSLEEFERLGLDPTLVQCSIAWNKTKGTFRGLHFQRAPFDEVKVVRCTRGAVLDVIVDLRPGSPTLCRWTSVELSDSNRRMLYIPKGLAHGYLTLTDDAEVYYHVSAPYSPEHADGVRWDDPAFGIEWPFAPVVISDRDRAWRPFSVKSLSV
jgi:dTDP-4-dehydrorhamnose 3,5-epimerase